eukprot:4208123-Pleurochrysis_carterae.AAC.2
MRITPGALHPMLTPSWAQQLEGRITALTRYQARYCTTAYMRPLVQGEVLSADHGCNTVCSTGSTTHDTRDARYLRDACGVVA